MNGKSAAWKLLRDVILVAVGGFMLIYVTVKPPEDTGTAGVLLAAALAVLGVPFALRVDELIKRNGSKRNGG